MDVSWICITTMDYAKMCLVDLKNAAKVHRPPIKYYYIKSRKELIDILSLAEMPQTMIKEKLRIQDLRAQAKARNIPNIWRMRRVELMALLYPDPKEDNQDDDDAKEHDTPKKGERKNVRV